MGIKKIARAGVAAPERAEAGKTFGSTSPIYNYRPVEAHSQLSISEFLGRGQDAAITRRDLERLTGLDGRTIRIVIERERRRGVPILSSCNSRKNGYFLASNEMETAQFVQSMRRRAHEIIKTANAVEGGVTRWPSGE